MKKMTFIMTVVLVMAFTVPTFANSLLGMKGLISMPVADTQSKGKFSVGFQMVGNDGHLTMNYGVGKNLEGFAAFDINSSGVNVGIKARVLRESHVQPSLSVGIMNTNLFVVASKTMDYKTNIRGHLGFGTGKGFDGVYFGFSKLYNPITISSSDSKFRLPVTDLKLEYFDEKINLGADFYLNDTFKANVGLVNFRNFTYGISYSSLF